MTAGKILMQWKVKDKEDTPMEIFIEDHLEIISVMDRENIYLKIAPTLIHFGISGVQLSLAPFQKTDNAVLSNIFLDDENKL